MALSADPNEPRAAAAGSPVGALLRSEQSAAAGPERIGGKAHGLARLVAAGARVPPFCVITTEAFAEHLGAPGLAPQVEEALRALAALDGTRDRAALEQRAALLRDHIDAAPLPAALAAAVQALLPGLGPGPFAVRSSMVGEDGESRSFAGQLDTYLFQRAEDVPAAVVRCWASAFTARALVYRGRAGEAASLPRMGVVIQQMITGRVSGVMFTSNPTNGRADEVLLSACWGAGEGVVSGRANCDEFTADRAGSELSVHVADKDLQVVRRADGGPGTEEVPVPEAQRSVRCLTRTELQTLVLEGVRLAQTLGGALDIEWTLDAQGVYLLQARPITALAARRSEPTESDCPEVVWDNSNIQESYCGVTTPLTFSFARGAYASVYEQVMRVADLPEAEIAANRPLLDNLLGLLAGRVYYNINNWYRMLQQLPSFQRNKQDMEKMMGLDSPVDFVTDEPRGLLLKLRRIPRLISLGIRLMRRFSIMDREVQRFIADFESGYQSIASQRPRFHELSFSALMALLRRVDEELLGRWHTPIINDLYVMMSSGRLRRTVERAVGAETAAPLIANLMGGEDGIESTEPTRQIFRLSAMARSQPALRAALMEPACTLSEVRRLSPEFGARLDDYIERYGDRCMGELKLETVSLREDPSFLLRLLRSYLDREDLDVEAIAQKERKLRADAEAQLRSALGALRFGRARKVLSAARTAVKHRENMRLMRTRMFGLVRDLYRALGERLAAAGRLVHPRDVFYLTVQEIKSYYEGTAVSADTRTLSTARKAEYAAFQSLSLLHRIHTRGPVYHGNALGEPTPRPPARGTGSRQLRGTGCYPGVVEAAARIILNPGDDLNLAGKILVTLRTDPGWAPLFPLCRGILVERGSTLSHSAILARELGIPAIVGIPELLRTVQDGERLHLDGSSGLIERLEAQ
jgi:pyruvate,water dikinase